MKRISTHILDLVQGKPATDVPVRLEKRNSSGDWRLLASATPIRMADVLSCCPESENSSRASIA